MITDDLVRDRRAAVYSEEAYPGDFLCLSESNEISTLNAVDVRDMFEFFTVVDDGSGILMVYAAGTDRVCFLMQATIGQ